MRLIAHDIQPRHLAAGDEPDVRLHVQANPGQRPIALWLEADELTPDGQPVSDGQHGGDCLRGPACGGALRRFARNFFPMLGAGVFSGGGAFFNG